jgi:hypothetical protein
MSEQEFVFSKTKMARLGKEPNEIYMFTIHLEALNFEDIYVLCWEWLHM